MKSRLTNPVSSLVNPGVLPLPRLYVMPVIGVLIGVADELEELELLELDDVDDGRS